MRQSILDDITFDRLEKFYPSVQSMNVEVVFKDRETGEVDSYVTDTFSLVKHSNHEIVHAMEQIESKGDHKYNVLTRNETVLGKMYHCKIVSNLDTDFYQVLEVQWG